MYGWTKLVEAGVRGQNNFPIECRRNNKMEVLDWSPLSPDWNLIEALWGDMEAELIGGNLREN